MSNEGLIKSFLLFTLLLILSTALADPPDHSMSGGNDPLSDITTRLNAMEQLLTDIKKEVIHCTARAKSRGECDQVREAKVSACFELALLQGELPVKWRTEVEGKAEGGVAWTSGPDGKIILNVKMPAGPVPTDFGLDVKTGAAIKADVCVDIPIQLIGGGTFATQSLQTRSLTEEEFDVFQSKLEEASVAIMPAIVERLNTGLPSGDRIRTGFDAIASIADGDFDLRGGVFADRNGNGPLVDVIGSLPVPKLLRMAIANPAELSQYLPTPQRGKTLQERVSMLCDPDSGMLITRSPLVAAQVDDMCMFLNGVPQFDVLAELTVDDVVDGVKALLGPLLADAGETAEETRQRFCATTIGQRRVFDRLCGRR
jgi:hypothetical protein